MAQSRRHSIVWLAAWVYLSAFTASASGYDTAVRLVPWNEHTPPLLFLLFLLPTCLPTHPPAQPSFRRLKPSLPPAQSLTPPPDD